MARRVAPLLAALVLVAGSRLPAQETPAPWWRTAVCPMVGPFKADSGPAGITVQQILEDYHPEVAEWSCLPALKDQPLAPRGIRGGLEYQEFPQSPAHDLKLWLDRFGAAYEPTEDNGVAVPSSGQISAFKYGSENERSLHYMCHNAPRWHDLHKASIIAAAKDPTCSLVRQDNIGSPSGVGWDNGGWCKWCLAGFAAHLQALSPARRQALGLDDLAAFEPRAALQALLKLPAEQRLESGLAREFVRFLLRSNLALWQDEVAASHAVRPEVPICGNQGSHGPQPYPYVLLSDAGDLIFLENSNRAFTQNPNGLWYALCLAGGRHHKPAWIWDFGSPEYMQQVAGSQLFVAECYTHGATPYYELNNLGWTAQKGYYSIAMGGATYAALARYAQFARAHRDLLAESYAADTPVALLYSVPSAAPRYLGALSLGESVAGTAAARNHFVGFARALEAGHVPYNVEILGDEELWPDRDLADRLARYRVLLCPDLEALSEQQVQALRDFEQRGGTLVISGLFANRDERFERRREPAGGGLERSPRTVRLQSEPADFLTASAVSEARGASQTVTVGQTEARPLVVRGWSRAQEVSGPRDNQYSLWVDLTYTDGTPLWAQVAPFRVGTHDWEQAEVVIYPAKPVRSATVHALLRYHSGRAWFDDLYLGEQGSEKNLLSNPGFEGGDGKQVPGWEAFLGWQKSPAGYVPDATVGHSGAGSIGCAIAPPREEAPARRAMQQLLSRALAGVPIVRTSAPPTVQVRPYRHGGRTVVHLLNLDIDADRDTIRPAGPFSLSVPLPAGTTRLQGPVTLYPADGEQAPVSLPARVEGGAVQLQVPGLAIWSVVAFEPR